MKSLLLTPKIACLIAGVVLIIAGSRDIKHSHVVWAIVEFVVGVLCLVAVQSLYRSTDGRDDVGQDHDG